MLEPTARILFRFCFCYFALYLGYALINLAELPAPLFGKPLALWHKLTLWAGVSMLQFSTSQEVRSVMLHCGYGSGERGRLVPARPWTC